MSAGPQDPNLLKPFSGTPAKLEPNYQEAYNGWKIKPDKTSTGQLLRTLQPSIDRAIQAHVGEPHPLIRSRARNIVLKSLPTYDPAKSSLNTYVMNQLYSLRRVNRKQTQIISVPERWSHEAGTLARDEANLKEMLGREPTTGELADHSGVSLRRIARIRSFKQPLAEGQLEAAVDSGHTSFDPRVRDSAADDRWADVIYMDLTPTDQKIMEHTLGMYGRPVLQNQQLANMLGLSAGAVSQRKAKIQAQLAETTRVF